MPGVSASSGNADRITPASQGSGSRPVVRNTNSVSTSSEIACCTRVVIQPNMTPATIKPHSMLERRPIGVPGGMMPSLTTFRAASIATRVASRCHATSSALMEGRPKSARVLRIVMMPTPA
jgi:hypothetical protein